MVAQKFDNSEEEKHVEDSVQHQYPQQTTRGACQ